MLIKSATKRGIDMEFSHVENDTVYVKGTEQDKSNILTLISAAKNSFSTLTYAAVEPETIDQVKIKNSDDTLTLSKGDLSAIFCVLSAMESRGYYTEKLGILEERFEALNNSIDDIHLQTFGTPEI